jgi:nicotinamide-nucleotide amidase
VGVATTGVAGPEPHAGEPVGSVWIAVSTPEGSVSEHLNLKGDRESVRAGTVQAAMALIVRTLGPTRE